MEQSYLKYYIIGGIFVLLMVLFGGGGSNQHFGSSRSTPQEQDPALRDLKEYYEKNQYLDPSRAFTGQGAGTAPNHTMPSQGGYQGGDPYGGQGNQARQPQQVPVPPNWSVSPNSQPSSSKPHYRYSPDSKLKTGESIIYAGTKVLKTNANGKVVPLPDGRHTLSDGSEIVVKGGHRRIYR